MKVLTITLSFLLIAFAVDAQKIRKKKEYYDNGQLKSIGDYEHSMGFYSNRNRGLWKFYHENGQLESTGNYDADGSKQGIWKYYYDNGQLSAVEDYQIGEIGYSRPSGTWKWYHENGQLKEIGDYKQGYKDGEWKEYYQSGQLRSIKYFKENYSNGLRWESQKHGTWKSYYPDGTLEQSSAYDEGQKSGVWTWYGPNGKVEKKGEYRKNEPVGNWTYYHEDGTLGETEDYDFINASKYFTQGSGSTNLDGKTSLMIIQNSANNGNANAQHLLGSLYFNGEGVEKDLSKAVSWFKKSANGGNSDAQFALGALYDEGIGVAQDHDLALHWYKEALKANPKNSNALFNLGAHYINRGAAIDEKAKAVLEEDDDTYNKLIAQANNEYSLALPYLMDYLELNPGSIDYEVVLNVMNSIKDRLEDDHDGEAGN